MPTLFNQEYTNLLSNESYLNKKSSFSIQNNFNRKARVFQFESPLAMLKKAVDSRSPPKNMDIPDLVSNHQILEDISMEKLYKSDCKGVKEKEKQSSLAELARKHEGKSTGLSSSSLSSRVGKLSLADLAIKHSSQQSKPVSCKTDSGRIRLSDIRSHVSHGKSKPPSVDSGEVPMKLSKLSLADLSSQHHKKEAGLANHGSSCSNKPASLAGLASLYAKETSHAMPELSNHLFHVKSRVAQVKEEITSPHEGKILISDSKQMAVTCASVSGEGSLHSKQKLPSGNSPSTTKGIDLTKALLTSKPIKGTNSVAMGVDETESTPAMEDGGKEDTTQAHQLERLRPQMTFNIPGIQVISEVKGSPSQFGGLVAQMSHKFGVDKCPTLRFPSFSYSRQSKIRSKLPSPPAEINVCARFDFATPSPDDIVKAKQEQAFTALSSKPLT